MNQSSQLWARVEKSYTFPPLPTPSPLNRHSLNNQERNTLYSHNLVRLLAFIGIEASKHSWITHANVTHQPMVVATSFYYIGSQVLLAGRCILKQMNHFFITYLFNCWGWNQISNWEYYWLKTPVCAGWALPWARQEFRGNAHQLEVKGWGPSPNFYGIYLWDFI